MEFFVEGGGGRGGGGAAEGAAEAERRAAKKKQEAEMLAVGDAAGNLHVFELPRNLWRASPAERGLVVAFVQREARRADAADRARPPEAEDAPPPFFEGEEKKPEEGAGEEEEKGGAGGAEDEDEEGRVDPLELARKAAQEEYEALEGQLIEELGLQEADLSDLWRKAQDEKRAAEAAAAAAAATEEPEQ